MASHAYPSKFLQRRHFAGADDIVSVAAILYHHTIAVTAEITLSCNSDVWLARSVDLELKWQALR
jgi:hypothetical protein